jgi:RNA polymerase sigma-54 factor
MDVRLGVSPVAKPKPTPKTVVVSNLLELASADLEQAIQSELAENPALKVAETAYCERCGSTYSGKSCPRCEGERRGRDSWDADEDRSSWGFTDEDDWDPFSTVAAPWSLRDHLLWQLSPLVSSSELEIASLLIENLDHRGLLDCDLECIASAAGSTLSTVENVLALIQRQDPVGLGAGSVQESLLIQLDTRRDEPEVTSLGCTLISEHWESLCKGKVDKIAKTLGVSAGEVARAREYISSHLHPYPLVTCPQPSGTPERPVDAAYLRPDVVIAIRSLPGEEKFDVRFPSEGRFRLSLDRSYQELSSVLEQGEVECDAEALEHVRHYLGRGQLFITGWEERWRTLRAITEALVAYQRDFLLRDARWLRPLTRAQLAEMVGLHESTVSRAVSSKYALIPAGQIIPLADFFDASLRAKALMKEWISDERRPLTDGELAEMLADEGVSAARRTVAKYRQELRILPSELR